MTACNGSESFALQVLGSSMEPEFPADCIIVVEPTGVVEDGCFVVAQQRDEVILRQLKRHGGSWTLHALENGHPVITLDDLSTVRGRVIHRAGRKRHEGKSYI